MGNTRLLARAKALLVLEGSTFRLSRCDFCRLFHTELINCQREEYKDATGRKFWGILVPLIKPHFQQCCGEVSKALKSVT